jgi:hypothetical protein
MEQCLSTGGKEVLIKSVAQAIPTFSMSCFKLPRGLCQHLDGLLPKFWWGFRDGKRKTYWVVWEDMTKPKYFGGLGFWDMEMFNLALLAKQAWRLLQDENSLSAWVLKAIYFLDTSFLDAVIGQSPSRIWWSIMEGKEVLKGGLIGRIGTGESTNIWSMDWLPTLGLRRPVPCTRLNPPQWVSELIDQTTTSWDRGKLLEFFTPADVEAITSIPLSTRHQEDFWAWHFEKHGFFSIRSPFIMLINHKFLAGNVGVSNR